MKSCQFENYFVDYVSGELDINDIYTFQAHLDNCPTCPERLDEFYQLHNNLKSRTRKKPNPQILEEYTKNLTNEFSQNNLTNTFGKKIDDFFEYIFWQHSLNIKLAEIVGLVLIGVLIGWFLFTPQSDIIVDNNINQEYFSKPISKAELEYINYYFHAAELLLLEIKNIEMSSHLNKAEIEFNKNIAQKLLIKTFIIHEIALRQNDPKILRFLSKMELLLYEVSNVPTEELSQSLGAFNVIIDDSRLLDDARKFQKDFIRYQVSPNENEVN